MTTQPTPPNSKDEIRKQIYELMDAFIVESKNQHGEDRSLNQLNRDRHLFVENMEKLIHAHDKALIAAVLAMPSMQDEITYANYDDLFHGKRGTRDTLRQQIRKEIADLDANSKKVLGGERI